MNVNESASEISNESPIVRSRQLNVENSNSGFVCPHCGKNPDQNTKSSFGMTPSPGASKLSKKLNPNAKT